MTRKNTIQRLLAFDAMKCFAILLVIWGHCIGELSSCNIADRSMYRIIYSFHMPLFMMISGYFATSSMSLPPITFLKKKSRQLIYPCLVIGFIIWIIIESTHSFHFQRENISFGALLIDYYWFSDFWFLKSCFICYCLAYLGIKSKIKEKYWIIITLLLSQCIVPFFVSFMYPCFILGMEIRINEKIKEIIHKYRWTIIACFVILLFFYSSEAWTNSHGIPSGLLNADIYVWFKVLFYRLFRLFIGIIGALAFYIIFLQLFEKEKKSVFTNILGDWGKYTLEVYILQAVILERTIAPFLNLDFLSPFVYNFVVTPLLSVLLLMIFILLTKTIYKVPKLGMVLFGKSL